jgi:radical SAM superfamily enzyme YgiQ (UPF0313 family)
MARRLKILLVVAASPTDPLRRNDPFMPLSLPLLAATAPDHDYTLVDLLWDDGVDMDAPWDLVGISARLTGEPMAYQLADAFRARGVPVILGGPQASSVPLRAIEHADAVAVGEGEPLWPAIVRDVANGELKHFYVCLPGTFDVPEGRTVHRVDGAPDLAQIPVASRELFRRRYRFDTVFATRGCPIDCDFCAVPQLFGRGFRHRPIEDVVREIDRFRNYYYLIDDTVFGKPATYDYYLELFDAIKRLPRRRFWTGQGNLDAAADPRGREVITRAARAGLLYAMIGMESVHPATLQRSGAIRKMGVRGGQDALEGMRDNIRFIQDLGIVVSGWFVVGYEDDTLDTWNATLQFCREMNVIPVITPVKALPGTRLHSRLAAEGRLDDSRFLNVRQPGMDDDAVMAAWRNTAREAFSIREIWRRTRFYASRFPDERIHRTMFTWILQTKMRKGLIHDDFYNDPGRP